ncbi:MAG: 23S rRNA (guanosine(2251)-2'-O)-methyltransferase RlmB [Elusimicrobia bacterium]|nr:23S rRNA (guanosine(2251)-2'-O)-methyltransferase RlmB [Elusimicrobiota bacterium]
MSKEIIYGINCVSEAIKNSNREIYRVIACKENSERISTILKNAAAAKIRIDFSERKILDKICQSPHHQGIAAEVSHLKTYEIFEALALEKEAKKAMWLAADSITDPANLGSMIRSAVCLGFTALVLPKNRTAGINSTVAKVSSGALEKIKIIEVSNLNSSILELKEKGFWIYGADAKGEEISQAQVAFPLLMIIGSEGDGMRLKTKEHCDKIISVNQKSDFDSLNASIAAAILMYQISLKNK